MSRQSKISMLLTLVTVLVTLAFFNNCGAPTPTGVNTASSGGGGGGGGGGSADDPNTPRGYFNLTIEPLFRTRCAFCHVAVPTQALIPPGTSDAIFGYTYTRNLALNGAVTGTRTVTNNPLYNKMKSAPGYTHQDLICANDLATNSPCKEVRQWLIMENPQLATGMAGIITSVSALGRVEGWALNPQTPSASINIVAYVDGPAGQGTRIGSFPANGGNSGIQAGHVFDFNLPAQFLNGVPRMLYVYGVDENDPDNLLPNAPMSFTAFPGTQAGANYFQNTVLPAMNCQGCHTWTREMAFARLVQPTPLMGGNADNNVLIRKMSGQNHNGGNRCGNGNAACNAVRTWYGMEGL